MNYFILVNNQQQGPYTLEELRSRNISGETLVWAEGMPQWTPAWQVEDLQTLFRPTPPVPPVRQPQTDDDATGGSTAAVQQGAAPAQHRSGCARLLTVLVIALGVLLGVLVTTCPTADQHRDAVNAEMQKVVSHATDAAGGDNDAWGMMGRLITQQLTGVVVDQLLRVDNYLVCSVGSVQYRGKTKHVSFGILGHVYTFDADDVVRALQKGSDAADRFSTPATGSDDGADTPSDGDGTQDDGTQAQPGNGTPAPDGNGQDSPQDDDGQTGGTVNF